MKKIVTINCVTTRPHSIALSTAVLCAALLITPATVLGHSEDHANHHTNANVTETTFGKPATASAVTRTIDISMGDDMRFKPENIDIKQGEVIRFKLKNTGTMAHEMVLGTADDITEHAEMMKKMPGMQHNDANMVRVQAGQTGEILWNFDLAGDFQFACLIPGHREGGMKGVIHVAEVQ